CLQPDMGGVGSPSGCDKDVRARNGPFISSCPRTEENSVWGTSLDPDHVGIEHEVDALSGEDAPYLVGDVGILASEELRWVRDDGHAAPEAPACLRELETDVAAPENHEMLGHAIELEKLDIRQRPGVRQPRDRRNGCVGPEVEEDPVASENARPTAIQSNLHGPRCDETSRAHDQFGTARLVVVQVRGDLGFDHLALPLQYASHVGLARARHKPEVRRVADQVRNLRAPDLVLARETVDVRTRAADPPSFDDGGSVPGSGHVPGQELSAKSASQDENLVSFSRHGHLPSVSRSLTASEGSGRIE